MEVKATLRNLRIAPRKTREVIDLIRGKKVAEAKTALEFAVRKSSPIVLKLLNSAIASAKHDFQMEESNLFVYKITVDEGPTLKRWHPMSRGRAYPIMKRSSHINIILKEIEPTIKKTDEKPETILVKEAKKKEIDKKAPVKKQSKPKKTVKKQKAK